MKSYQDVVTNRFDKEIQSDNSIYSPNKPIGKYLRKTLFKGMNNFIKSYSKGKGELSTKKLLDVGCGSGDMLDFFIGKGFLPQNSVGVDLSQTRIERAKGQVPGVNFMADDILTFELTGQKFDLITAFDLFSHLNTHEQIIRGLVNIYNHLKDDGVFLWYDIYAKDHFAATTNSETWGFSKAQMISFSKESGFDVAYSKPFFKNFFNKYHSAYQVKRLPPSFVRFLEIILPGMPGNMMLVLKKTKTVHKT